MSGPTNGNGENGRRIVISGNLLMPLGVVCVVVGVIVGGAWWIRDTVVGGQAALRADMLQMRVELQRELDGIKRQVEISTGSRYTLIDAQIWSEKFKQSNRDLIVPEPIHYPLPGEGGER